uniref:glutamate dehydrogenase (NADP(+)) n=1 Tax=Lygus hesperus TaxID=30085 RepID=A0A0A9WY67_LYGHE
MLALKKDSLKGKTVLVSGAGNVAQYAIEKCLELNAKVITASDSTGFVYDPEGFTHDKLAVLMEVKNLKRASLAEYAKRTGVQYIASKRPWDNKADIALPCATQNEIELSDAKNLIKNNIKLVAEGANMPTTLDATKELQNAGVLFAPAKASNAGGVAISGLEMSQNALRLSWTTEEVDKRLRDIMTSIHDACVKYGQENEKINYVKGANIAGFVKVADAMLGLGVL